MKNIKILKLSRIQWDQRLVKCGVSLNPLLEEESHKFLVSLLFLDYNPWQSSG